MLPILDSGTPLSVPPTKSAVFVITVGTLLVNVCVVALHSNAPNVDTPVSNQYTPLAGSPVGRTNVAVRALRSTSALCTYALLLTPNVL